MRYTLAQAFPVPLPPNPRAHSPVGNRAQHESQRRVSRYGPASRRKGISVDYEPVLLRAAGHGSPVADGRLTLSWSVFSWKPPPCHNIFHNLISREDHHGARLVWQKRNNG